MRLTTRNRRRDESLAELAEDVERLVRLAYPDATQPMVEALAKDGCLTGGRYAIIRIHQHKPATLRDALAIALELESYQLASRQKAKYVLETQLEECAVQ